MSQCTKPPLTDRYMNSKITDMKTKVNYCVNCEGEKKFIQGKCESCKRKYDDVVPASYRNDYEYDYGK